MKSLSLIVAIAAVLGCGGSGNPGTGNPGTANAWVTNGNGTITSSDSGATASGTVSNAEVFAAHYAASTSTGNTDLGIVELVATYSGAGSSSNAGTITFTKPSGVTGVTLVSTIGIKGTPGTGDYTNTSTNSCGGLVLAIQTATTVTEYTAFSPYDCQDSNTTQQAGTFDLHLSSTSELDSSGNVVVPGSGSASWAYYKVSGTLTATLSDGKAGDPTVNVSITF